MVRSGDSKTPLQGITRGIERTKYSKVRVLVPAWAYIKYLKVLLAQRRSDAGRSLPFARTWSGWRPSRGGSVQQSVLEGWIQLGDSGTKSADCVKNGREMQLPASF
jgi:hypothetical protein